MDDRDASRVYEAFPDKSNLPYIQGVSTFAFRKRWGQVDWKKLASVDVDRIARNMDFQALQQNVMNIAFCNIQTEEFHDIDPNFIKLFRLAQLIIEYLLHSQQYLSNQSTSLHQKLLLVHQNLDKSVNDLKIRDEELKSIKKESRKRRKIIEAYQDMINAGATGLHSCPICKREFVSSEYLQSHIHRRHPNHFPMTDNKPASQKPLISQEVLEAKVMERVSERLQMSEKQLREEMKQKEEEIISLQLKEYEEWKLKEKERMSIEIESFKRPIIVQMEELQQEKGQLEKRLKETEVELLEAQSRRKSHLGQLEGARELVLNEANQLNESKAEIKCLKEKLEIQMQEMQTALKNQDVSWKKKTQKLSASYHDQLTESIAKVEALEQSVLEGSRNDVQDQKLSKGLRSLQQKIKQQEVQLQTQQEQLALLQTSREHSPVRVHQHQDENFTESDENTEESEDKVFTPFASRPMIKTKYEHDRGDMEKVRKQMQAIVSDTLVHNGLVKDSTRLKKEEFDSKIRILDQEREQRIKAHYQFAEHRRRAEDTLDQIATTDCRPISTHKLLSSLQDTSKLPAAVVHKRVSKPPIPAPKILVSESVTQGFAVPLQSEITGRITDTDNMHSFLFIPCNWCMHIRTGTTLIRPRKNHT